MDLARRRLLLALAAAPACASAQTPPYVQGSKRRLGVIYFPSKKVIDSFPNKPGPLASLGWVEGSTLEKVKRYADGDAELFEPLARDLVAQRVDVLLSSGVPCTRAMQKATRTIPICAIVDDPVGNGFAKSMSRPGGNITGLCEGYAEGADKEIEQLRSVIPGLSPIVIVSTSREVPLLRSSTQWLIKAASSAGIAVDVSAPNSRAELEKVLDDLPPGRSALYLKWVDPKAMEAIARLATPRRVALVGQDEDIVDHGALMAFSPVVAEDRQLASMLDRLLRGGNPAEIPFELPTRWMLAINRKAAAALGVKFPSELAIRADRIVE